MMPTWISLRGVGNARIVQLSAIFPFVGYLILFNDEVSKFLSMATLDRGSHGSLIDILWPNKLYFLYFGLMFTGLASVIYQVRCPYIVKKHGDWADYVRIDGDSLSNAAAASLGEAVGRDYREDCRSENPDHVTMDYMRAWFRRQSEARPFSRIVAAIFFFLGFSLLALPSALSAVKIVNLIIYKLF
jgi:hypothetical protein